MDNFERRSMSFILVTERGIEEYRSQFKLVPAELAGKVILDVGAGQRKFAYDLEKMKIKAKVYSLDQYFSLPSHERTPYVEERRKILEKGSKNLRGSTVAARAEKLPFRDNSFDLVLSSYAMPIYARTTDQVDDFFREIIRVTKPGGEIRLYPINIDDYRRNLSKTVDATDQKLKLAQFIIDKIEELKVQQHLFLVTADGELLIIKKLERQGDHLSEGTKRKRLWDSLRHR